MLFSSRSHTLSADSFVICLHCLDSFSPFHYNRAISNTLNYLRCLRWQSSSATLVLISTDDRRIPHQNPCWRHSPSHTKSSASVIRMPPCVLPSCTDTDREFAFWEANVEGSEGDSQQRNSEQKQVSDQQRRTRWSFFFSPFVTWTMDTTLSPDNEGQRVFLWWNITTGGCGLSASLRPFGFPQAPAVVGHLDLRTICMFSSTFFNPFILNCQHPAPPSCRQRTRFLSSALADNLGFNPVGNGPSPITISASWTLPPPAQPSVIETVPLSPSHRS